MKGQNFTFGEAAGAQKSGGQANGQQETLVSGGGDLISDVTTASFQNDVLVKSREVPVLVDFWAPWCGPCKQLTPVLEKAVKAAGGAVRLAKMNIDEHPEIPGQLGVQSIPAVVAFKNGQFVDGFMGAQTEGQVKAFIEKIAGPVGPSGAEQALEAAAAARAAKDYSQAAQLYAGVLAQDQGNTAALAGMAHCYLGSGDPQRARQALESVPTDKAEDPDIVSALAAIDLAEQASELGDLAELQAKVDNDRSDLKAKLDLAIALGGKGRRNAAVDQLLEIVRQDREWQDDAGRKQLLQFFEAWGPADPGTVYGRRKLSAVLFS